PVGRSEHGLMARRRHPALEIVDEMRAKNGQRKDRSEPITAAALMGMTFEPTRWVVPDVLPEGVTLLAGKPKKGKSWMALGMCESVAVGGVALGTKRVEQGDTLYLALEDNVKRLQKRLKKVLDGRAAPKHMHLHTEWPRLDEGGAEALDEWLTEHPDARLVVIDTLAKIRRPVGGANVYAEDYAALEQLLPLAAKHGVAIVVVHHLRKAAAADPMDEISSSTGLTGGVDGFLILRRTPGSKGPTLFVDGRDIEEPTEYALHWNLNTATWTIEGNAEEVHVSKERADILLVLNRSPVPMMPKEVWEVLGGKRDRIRQLLVSMFNDGQVLKDDKGRYSPAHPTNPPDHGGHSDHRPHSDHSDHRSSKDHGALVDHSTDHRPTADTYAQNGGAVTAVTAVIGDGSDGGDSPPRRGHDIGEGRSLSNGSNGSPFIVSESDQSEEVGKEAGYRTTSGEKTVTSVTSVTAAEPDAPPELAALLEDPPGWFRDDAATCIREGNPRALVNPLANRVASELYGNPWRWREVLGVVEERLKREREHAEKAGWQALGPGDSPAP
ncbi:MAG: helicase RepA family protein, partial [Actinomycetota bacterium]|nr:helicase RepA family protein [Actinomycetota bacterium]